MLDDFSSSRRDSFRLDAVEKLLGAAVVPRAIGADTGCGQVRAEGRSRVTCSAASRAQRAGRDGPRCSPPPPDASGWKPNEHGRERCEPSGAQAPAAS